MKTVVSTIVSSFFLMATLAYAPAEAKQQKQQAGKNVAQQQVVPQAVEDCCYSCCENCLEPVYASGHSDDVQTISTAPFEFTPIHFEINTVPPVGIDHPVSGDDTQFFLNEDGVYLIEWHMDLDTVVDLQAVVTGYALVQIRDLLTDTVIASSVVETTLDETYRTPLAGQTLAEFPGGTYINLEISTFGSEVDVAHPTIVITRVS